MIQQDRSVRRQFLGVSQITIFESTTYRCASMAHAIGEQAKSRKLFQDSELRDLHKPAEDRPWRGALKRHAIGLFRTFGGGS